VAATGRQKETDGHRERHRPTKADRETRTKTETLWQHDRLIHADKQQTYIQIYTNRNTNRTSARETYR